MDGIDHFDLAKWHLVRADQLRLGLVNRVSALLSANALIVAGLVILSDTEKTSSASAIRALCILALAATACSVFRAAGALSVGRKIPTLSHPRTMAISLAFSYSDTVETVENVADFQERFRTQTPGDSLDSATLELWRCLNVHHL